jgi:hypothetical protein
MLVSSVRGLLELEEPGTGTSTFVVGAVAITPVIAVHNKAATNTITYDVKLYTSCFIHFLCDILLFNIVDMVTVIYREEKCQIVKTRQDKKMVMVWFHSSGPIIWICFCFANFILSWYIYIVIVLVVVFVQNGCNIYITAIHYMEHHTPQVHIQ